MTRRKATVRGLMAAIAGTAVLLGAHQAGRRTERFANPPPVLVWLTRTGDHYHQRGCRYLRGAGVSTPVEQAKGKYRPCSVCRPPR